MKLAPEEVETLQRLLRGRSGAGLCTKGGTIPYAVVKRLFQDRTDLEKAVRWAIRVLDACDDPNPHPTAAVHRILTRAVA